MLQGLPWPSRKKSSDSSGLDLAPLVDAAAMQLEARKQASAPPRHLDIRLDDDAQPDSPLHRGGVDLEYLRLHDIQMR